MIRLIVSTLLFLGSAAVGLLVAKLTLDDMTITVGGFLWVVVVFAAVQAVITPFLFKIVHRNAAALLGAVGLISTYIALFVASVLSSGLVIRGATTWVLAGLIVWIVTMLASLLLPLLVAKKYVARRRGATSGP